MNPKRNKRIKLFAGSGSIKLATKVAEELGIQLGKVNLEKFSDGEYQPVFDSNLRGRDVCLFQSCPPPFDNYWELFQMIDAAKRASAKEIICFIPYYGYARQDRKDKPRVGIASKLIARFLEAAGATRVVMMDLHADQIQGFFDIPSDQLYGTYVFWPHVEHLQKIGEIDNVQFAAPDNGGTKRAKKYAEKFDTDFVICFKNRKKKNEIDQMILIGDVKGRHVILLDDMIDTGGTICKAADLIMEKGALSVRAMITHPVLSGKAVENIEKSKLTKLYVLDTIPVNVESEKIEVLTTAELFGQAVKKISNKKSLSSLFLK